MVPFPDRIHNDAGLYLDSYAAEISKAFASVDRDQLRAAAECLKTAIAAGQMLYSCGNGGSCAIANHLMCDFLKGAQTGTSIKPRVDSLSANIETITAIANDVSFDDIFALQLRSLGKPGDVLLTISSSGNSTNILAALEWARTNGLRTIAMSGFSGGKVKDLADISLHVAAENYGIIEDVHQSLMHLLAQWLRQNHLIDPTSFSKQRF